MTERVEPPQWWVTLDGIPHGWICEDCNHFAFTEQEAFDHSDDHGHSLAICPLWMPVRS